MDRELREFLERGIVALEALAQDPVISIEAAPPICPHCNRMNPTVKVESDSEGPLAECVLIARCQGCNELFYAVPVTWHMFTNQEGVLREFQERAEMMSNGGN
jgi:hypothetical protein